LVSLVHRRLLEMTVTYMQHVHTAKFGSFIRLLGLWRGSIFKGIGRNILVYLVLYTGISFAYQIILSRDEWFKQGFERVCLMIREHKDVLPLDFILGFYVTQVVSRWWCQFTSLYWVDTLAMDLAAFLPGQGQAKKVRRQLVRLANLSSVMALRRLSTSVAKRFPTFHHLVGAGLMTETELKRIEYMIRVMSSHQAKIHGNGWEPQLTWEPVLWAQAVLRRAKEAGMDCLDNPLAYVTLHKDLADVARCNHTLISYSWVSLPLVYTQLVTLAVHLYFFFTLFSSQYLQPTMFTFDKESGSYSKVPFGTPNAVNLVGYNDDYVDAPLPVFTLLKFMFYFGWLHVAEVLINPFGEDDEDFNTNYLIDRNLQASYLMVEGGDEEWQELEDPYLDSLPTELPHTAESFKTAAPPPAFPTDGIRKSLSMSVFLDKLDKDKVFLDKDKEDKEETTHRQRTTSLARRASTISAILAARRRDADDDDEEEEECEGDHDTITSLAGARLLQDYQQKLKH